MKTNLIILDRTYKIINYINKILINYLKNERVLKESIEKNQYDLIKNIYSYNINDSVRIKDKNLKDISADLSMLSLN